MIHNPKEPGLPPPTPPVDVEEDEVTISQPTTDRENLLKCFKVLAEKTHEALERDRVHNDRYARRLRISNRVKNQINRYREEFIVNLPVDEVCWNDLDREMLGYCMMATIVNIDSSYVWHKVRAHFDQFISKETRECMRILDEEDEADPDVNRKIASLFKTTETNARNSQSTVNTNATQRTPEVNLAARIAKRKCDKLSTPLAKHTKTEPQCENISDDDDDDIEIVYESTPEKKLHSSKRVNTKPLSKKK